MDSWTNGSVSSESLSRKSSEYSFHIADTSSPLLDNAIRNIDLILSNQTKALSFITSQYRNSTWSVQNMKNSLRILNNSLKSGGKIVISGMGKSYKIASKTVATLNSLRMHSALLHPSEALHGDLGMIREDHGDSLIIISASGNSPELLQMLEHTPITVPVVLMTCNKNSILSKHPKVMSLLLAEIPSSLSETNLYGLSAPTISTTLCLTLLDAVCISLSELHINDYTTRKEVFRVYHPGGAIGIDYKLEQIKSDKQENTIAEEDLKDINHNEKDIIDGSCVDPNGKGSVSSATTTNLDDDCFDIEELILMKKVKNTKYKSIIEKFPENESDFHKLVILNDYIIIQDKENSSLLDCELVRIVIRDCESNEDDWSEAIWKIKALAHPFNLEV